MSELFAVGRFSSGVNAAEFKSSDSDGRAIDGSVHARIKGEFSLS